MLHRLFGRSESPAPSAPSPKQAGPPPPTLYPRVLAIIHNPVIAQAGGRKAKDAYGWNDPDTLAQGYISALQQASHGLVQYEIVERLEVDGFPAKQDSFSYTPDSFDNAWKSRQFHQPDAVDYLKLVTGFKLIEKVDAGQIDEVWLLGFPYCGYYESLMAGPGAFWCNAPPLAGTEHASRRFVIMGFNYERGVGEMLENMGHRVESIMSKVYSHTKGDANLYERFIRYDKKAPGKAECGNVHFAPNSERDYDWGNRRPVASRCDTWLNFPDLSGPERTVTCADWGNGDIRKHHVWWLSRLPHVQGEADGVRWNWWEYIIDSNRV